MSTQINDAARMQRIWDIHEIKNLMGRRAYLHASRKLSEELDTLWVREDAHQQTASYGQNDGYVTGMAQIRTAYEQNEDVPSDLMRMHALTTPYIEIASDGKTAQGIWYSPGQVTQAESEGAKGYYVYERYGADFMREDGQWKIWHLFIGTDITIAAGEDMTAQPIDAPQKSELQIQTYTIPMTAYTPRYNYSHYPAIPAAYQTFDDAAGNGPQGNPHYQKGGAS